MGGQRECTAPPHSSDVQCSSLTVALFFFLFFVLFLSPSPENRIVRPFQVYVGPGKRDYVNMADRAPAQSTKVNIISDVTADRGGQSVLSDRRDVVAKGQLRRGGE